MLYYVSPPHRWSCVSFTQCSCHRKVRSSPAGMATEDDSAIEMLKLIW